MSPVPITFEIQKNSVSPVRSWPRDELVMTVGGSAEYTGITFMLNKKEKEFKILMLVFLK